MSEDVDVGATEEETPNRTPLMIASDFAVERSIEKLLERNAQTEQTSHGGHTALHWAAKSSRKNQHLTLSQAPPENFQVQKILTKCDR